MLTKVATATLPSAAVSPFEKDAVIRPSSPTDTPDSRPTALPSWVRELTEKIEPDCDDPR